MGLAILFLGLMGGLGTLTSWAILAIGWSLAGWKVLYGPRDEADPSFTAWLKQPVGWAGWWLLAVPFLVLALVGAMVPPGMLWTPLEPHGYDVVEYHLQVPREWYEAHHIGRLHHNVFSYFPFIVEMHYLLAMHLLGGPWAGMYLAQLMHLAFMILTVLAVYGLARRWQAVRRQRSRAWQCWAFPGSRNLRASPMTKGASCSLARLRWVGRWERRLTRIIAIVD